ncbi:MAG TPA: T9SS type A sorting domain-containing protein [Bacteroidales bacterium]|nr:T9SS type A sorting domain-containing protein [Bacteroidales bacterium]
MNKTIRLTAFALTILGASALQAQCIPDSLNCPDLENNGEICPDTFPAAVVNVPYSVEATILPPPQVVYMGFPVPIHHIDLVSVDNLPPGLTYQSNEPSGTFYPGTYYCVLMSGTPTQAGTYPLKIKVDAYVNFLGTPVLAGQQTDSTSLAIVVQGSAGLGEPAQLVSLDGPWPNPFGQGTSFTISRMRTTHTLRVSDVSGKVLYQEKLEASSATGNFRFTGQDLAPGLYVYTIEGNGGVKTGKLVRQ